MSGSTSDNPWDEAEAAYRMWDDANSAHDREHQGWADDEQHLDHEAWRSEFEAEKSWTDLLNRIDDGEYDDDGDGDETTPQHLDRASATVDVRVRRTDGSVTTHEVQRAP